MRKLLIISTISLLTLNFSSAQISNYKGQAVFLYNFTKHIKWPNTRDVFTIGVLGKSDIFSELTTTLKGKQVEGKDIVIININSASEATKCQIVYLPRSKSQDVVNVANIINTKDILLISEDDLPTKGAAISFLQVDDKLRFKLDQDILAKCGFQVGNGLISLAYK